MRHDTWVEDGTFDSEWMCRWTCSCGSHGEWANAKARDLVQEQKIEHMAEASMQ